MSYLPPEESGFYEAIQVFFTEVTGRMALFGAQDRSLLDQWKEQGRPTQLVCRGIRKAAAARDEPLRSLKQCEPYIDREWQAVKKKTVGRRNASADSAAPSPETQRDHNGDGASSESTSKPLLDAVRDVIVEAGESADEARWRRAYRQAWREMKRLHREHSRFSFAELQALDTALVDAYCEALCDEERQRLESSIAKASAGLVRQMSTAARRDHLAVKRKQALVERYGLLDLIAAVDS